MIFISFLRVISCENDIDIYSPLKLDKVNGYAQKGFYLNGTSITISVLSEDLVPSRSNYPPQVLDNKGTFEVKNVNKN